MNMLKSIAKAVLYRLPRVVVVNKFLTLGVGIEYIKINTTLTKKTGF